MRALVLAALLLGCGARGSFACSDDDDCAGVAGGACEATGVCSFPDAGCESGRRYGEWAGGLAMSCVPVDVATGSTGMATDDEGGTVVTLTDPTTFTTSATLTSSMDGGETTSPIDPDTSTSMNPPTSGEDTATTGEPLDPDLVAWYRFEDELDGVVIDEVGLHDGACADEQCPLSIEGAVGKAAEFDGIDDVVHVALSDLLMVDAAITVALWVRIDVAGDEFRTFASKAYADTISDTWELGLAGTEIQFVLMITPMEFAAVSRGAAPLATWVHAAGVWNGDVIRLYLDGALIGETIAADVVQDDHEITLGAGNDFGADENFLDGALDEVRIYRRALTGDEIAALAVAP